MPQTGRTFRVFVSSTFADLVEERNALQRWVFPRLRELSAQYGARFQDIDLRWGVSQEAGLDQQTIPICLGEIRRCQQASPRPNFIVLMGDRYGWRPLPYEIPAAEYEQIEGVIAASTPVFDGIAQSSSQWSALELLGRWYRRDDNALPPAYIIQPRSPGSRYQDDECWALEVERPLNRLLSAAVGELHLPAGSAFKYQASATHQEIELGVLQTPDAPQHVWGFFRHITNLEDLQDCLADPAARPYVDRDMAGAFDFDARGRLADLQRELAERLKNHIFHYESRWTDGGLRTDTIGQLSENLQTCLALLAEEYRPANLCEAVWCALGRTIEAECRQMQVSRPFEVEAESQRVFAENRESGFQGREELLKAISGYLTGNAAHPLAVCAGGGIGKSALMAKAAAQASCEIPDAVVVARFIGATPTSTQLQALLFDLCQQISEKFDFDADRDRRLAEIMGAGEEQNKQRQAIAMEYEIPDDLPGLVRTFDRFLNKVPPGRRLHLFLDGLDQLGPEDGAHNLDWLPAQLPATVRLIVSALTDGDNACFRALRDRLPAGALLTVPPLAREEATTLLSQWLGDAARQLTKDQRDEILDRFEQSGGQPLYLRLAAGEAIRWRSSDTMCGLSPSISGLIRDFLSRLSQEAEHGSVLVARGLGYLLAARHGLTEDELIDLLSSDEVVMADYRQRAPRSPQEQRLPLVVWSRLFFDLEPYLTERRADGTILLGFFHRQLAEVVAEEYLEGENRRDRQAALASYFELQSHWRGNREGRVPNLRQLSELPYLQAGGGRLPQMQATLLDYEFLQTKIVAGMLQDLLADYQRAHELLFDPDLAWIDDELRLLQGTLRLSASVLSRDPDMLPEQLWGRLANRREPRLQNLLEQARLQRRSPWLRPVLPCLETPGGPLLHILPGHNEMVFTIAIAPNDRLVVSGSADNTLRVYDLASGECIHVLSGHTGSIGMVAITPDGHRAISGALDGKVKVWDLKSGRCLQTLGEYALGVMVVVVTPDGQRAITASENTLTVWDLASGKRLQSLEGHTSNVKTVAVTSDGRQVISGSWDETLRVWDLTTGQCLHTLTGHDDFVNAVAVTPDGRLAVSASDDRSVKVWNLHTGKCWHTLTGHTGNVEALALTRDGRLVISAGSDTTLKVWDLASGRCLRTLEGHTDKVTAVAFGPDGRHAVSASWDRTLRVWDVQTGKCLHILTGHTDPINKVVLTSDGRWAVSSGSEEGTLRVWDINKAARQTIPVSHADALSQLGLTPDGRFAVSSDWKTVKVWDLPSGKYVGAFEGDSPEAAGVGFSPDGRYAFPSNWRGAFRAPLQGIPEAGPPATVTPDGRYAIQPSDAKLLTVWDLSSGERLYSLEGFAPLVVTPDGARAISASSGAALCVWELSTGRCLYTLTGHTGDITDLIMTQDDRRLVSASGDNTLRVWDMENGACLHTLKGHTRWVSAVSLTPDSCLAVSASWDHTLKVWDLTRGACLASFQLEERASIVRVALDGVTIVASDFVGRVCFLRLENVTPGPTQVTAWDEENDVVFSCPHCRGWSQVPRTDLDADMTCPLCAKPLHLNPFTLHGDWRVIQDAWLQPIEFRSLRREIDEAGDEGPFSPEEQPMAVEPSNAGIRQPEAGPIAFEALPTPTDFQKLELGLIALVVAIDLLGMPAGAAVWRHSWGLFFFGLTSAIIGTALFWGSLLRSGPRSGIVAFGMTVCYGVAWGASGWLLGQAYAAPGPWPVVLCVAGLTLGLYIHGMLAVSVRRATRSR